MINLGLFFNRSLSVNNIFFTGHVGEQSTFAVEVTDNPVEYGTNTVDNMFVKPTVLKVQPFVSELPAYSFSPEGIFNAFKETSDAIDVLYQLMVSRQLVEVNCNLGYFPNMALIEMTPSSDMDNLTNIPMELTFKQIIMTGEPGYEDPFQSQYRNMVNRGALQMLESLEELIV